MNTENVTERSPIQSGALATVGPLSPRRDTSPGYGWKECPPDMNGNCENTEQAF
jgi:hypothetical protein